MCIHHHPLTLFVESQPWHGVIFSMLSSVSAPLGTITSVGVDTGPFQGVLSGIQGPVNPFMEGKFPLISSGQPLSSPIRVPSVVNHGSQHGPVEPNRSLGQMNFGFQSLLPIQSHSLSDFHDGVGAPAAAHNRVGSLGSTNEGGESTTIPLAHSFLILGIVIVIIIIFLLILQLLGRQGMAAAALSMGLISTSGAAPTPTILRLPPGTWYGQPLPRGSTPSPLPHSSAASPGAHPTS